jgi:hypothetical protein
MLVPKVFQGRAVWGAVRGLADRDGGQKDQQCYMGERAVHGATILLFRLCLHTMMAHVSKNLERIVGNTDIWPLADLGRGLCLECSGAPVTYELQISRAGQSRIPAQQNLSTGLIDLCNRPLSIRQQNTID